MAALFFGAVQSCQRSNGMFSLSENVASGPLERQDLCFISYMKAVPLCWNLRQRQAGDRGDCRREQCLNCARGRLEKNPERLSEGYDAGCAAPDPMEHGS